MTSNVVKEYNLDRNTKYNDVIGLNEIEKFKIGQGIFLDGGTGTGKTYFITHNLAFYCKLHGKKILYLCNRSKLRDDVNEVKKATCGDIVTVTTYQALEKCLRENTWVGDYDFIVADECHYLIDDANFNVFTEISYNFLVNQANSIIIFMSATGKNIKNILSSKWGKLQEVYTIPKNYDYVDKLTFISGYHAIEQTIDNILETTDDKIIYFANSVEKAYQLYDKYMDKAYFYCSKYNSQYRTYSNYDCIVKKDGLITFDRRILITTSVLDNGIDLKDYDIKHIICDVIDLNKMVQCLGRKRPLDSNDKCSFYLYNYNNQQIGGFYRTVSDEVAKCSLFLNDREQFNKTYLENENYRIFYSKSIKSDSGEWVLNKMSACKYALLMIEYDNMLRETYKTIALDNLNSDHLKAIADELNYDKVNSDDNLIDFLESNVGTVYLSKKDREPVINAIDIKCNGRQLKNLSNLNGALEERKLNYRIVEFETSRIIEGKKKKFKSAWRIERLVVE